MSEIACACADLRLDVGEPGKAIDALRRTVHTIPLASSVVEAVMRAYATSGDPAGAARADEENAAALHQAKLDDPDDAIEELRISLQSAIRDPVTRLDASSNHP